MSKLWLFSQTQIFVWRIKFTIYGQYRCPIGWRLWWGFSGEPGHNPETNDFKNAVNEEIRCMY